MSYHVRHLLGGTSVLPLVPTDYFTLHLTGDGYQSMFTAIVMYKNPRTFFYSAVSSPWDWDSKHFALRLLMADLFICTPIRLPFGNIQPQCNYCSKTICTNIHLCLNNSVPDRHTHSCTSIHVRKCNLYIGR